MIFGLLIQISLCSSTNLYFSADRLNCTKFPSLKCAHISLWLNPTGHSKFHNISNHPPPTTDSGTCLLPPPLFCFLSWTEEPAKAGTCASDRRALQQLALNVHVEHSDLTWPDDFEWFQFGMWILSKKLQVENYNRTTYAKKLCF